MFRRLAWLLVGLSVTMAFALGGYRLWLNRQERTVDLVLDGRSYQAMAKQQGIGYAQLLAELKRSGATAVAVAEQDLASLQQAGLLTAMTGAELRQAAALGQLAAGVETAVSRGRIQDGYTYVLTYDPDMTARLKARVSPEALRSPAAGVWEIALAKDVVGQLTFGFDPADFAAVRQAGLRPVPRPANFPGADPGKVARVFEELDKLAPDARSVIFQGRETLGFPQATAATAGAIQARGWVVGLVEQPSGNGYIVQKGQELVAELVDYRVARVTIQPEAVATRGARMVYLKGHSPPEVGQIARRLSGAYKLGLPGGLSYVKTGRSVTAVLSLGLAGALMLLGGGGWTAAAVLLLAALSGPYLAPGAALWAQAGALGLIPALALLSGPGGSQADPDAGLAISWRLARYVGPGVAWAAAYLGAALAAAMVVLALRGSPSDLLGMTPQPSAALAVGLAVLAHAAVFWRQLRWDAPVSTLQLSAGVAVLAALGLAFAFPVAAPALVGAAAMGGMGPSPWRHAALAAGQAGAVALAVAPVSGALIALAGTGMGLALYAYHTYRSSAGRSADRGRETA